MHVALLECEELLRIEAGRGLVDTLQREALDHLLLTEELRPVIQRPAEQDEVVKEGDWHVADLRIEVHKNRIERLSRNRQAQGMRDVFSMFIELPEGVVLEVGADSALAQFILTAWLGDKRHMRVLRQWIT